MLKKLRHGKGECGGASDWSLIMVFMESKLPYTKDPFTIFQASLEDVPNPQRCDQQTSKMVLKHQGFSVVWMSLSQPLRRQPLSVQLNTLTRRPTYDCNRNGICRQREAFRMQNFSFKYEISPKALLYYYSNFLRRADIQCSVSPPSLETGKFNRNIQVP